MCVRCSRTAGLSTTGVHITCELIESVSSPSAVVSRAIDSRLFLYLTENKWPNGARWDAKCNRVVRGISVPAIRVAPSKSLWQQFPFVSTTEHIGRCVCRVSTQHDRAFNCDADVFATPTSVSTSVRTEMLLFLLKFCNSFYFIHLFSFDSNMLQVQLRVKIDCQVKRK